MKPLMLLLPFLLMPVITACDVNVDHNPVEYDSTPPFSPVGIYALALDHAVEIRWIANQEPDIAGYAVYASATYNGRYDRIGTTSDVTFTDRGAQNGEKYYYAVSAFDQSGNYSELSRDVAYATPRPEGLNVRIVDRTVDANAAGYDFSQYRVVYWDTDQTDVYLEITPNQVPYLVVYKDSQIQDMGYTATLDEITQSPTTGWNPTKDAQAIAGHTYCIKTWDGHYAKLRVITTSATAISFDWAYQLTPLDPSLVRMLRMPAMPRDRHALNSRITGSL